MCWVCVAPCLIVEDGQLPSVGRVAKFDNIFKVTKNLDPSWDTDQFGYTRPLQNGEELAGD